MSGVTNGDVDKVYVASVHLCKRAEEIPEPPGARNSVYMPLPEEEASSKACIARRREWENVSPPKSLLRFAYIVKS